MWKKASNGAASPAAAGKKKKSSGPRRGLRTKSRTKGGAPLRRVKSQHEWLSPRVKEKPYFHGMINKGEIAALLVTDGDWIIRLGRSEQAAKNVTLSVLWEHKPRHFIVRRSGPHKVYIDDGHVFADEVELVEFYQNEQTPLGIRNCLLMRPVVRQPWELERKEITLGPEIGKGAFGKVHSGTLCRPPKFRKIPVAVKLCDSFHLSLDAQNVFTKEAEIGRHLLHRHIIAVYGVQHTHAPLMIVMEFAGGGSLRSRLQKHQSSETQLLGFAREACAALEFLELKRVLHRDIAARNFLLSSAPELTVKLADFGLAKPDCEAYTMKTRTKIAVRWMAPEVMLRGEFSFASDVWSFGVVLWEIWSRGAEPWTGVLPAALKERVTGPEKLRLQCEASWAPAVAEVMKGAWLEDPAARFTIGRIAASLDRALGRPPAIAELSPPYASSTASPSSVSSAADHDDDAEDNDVNPTRSVYETMPDHKNP